MGTDACPAQRRRATAHQAHGVPRPRKAQVRRSSLADEPGSLQFPGIDASCAATGHGLFRACHDPRCGTDFRFVRGQHRHARSVVACTDAANNGTTSVKEDRRQCWIVGHLLWRAASAVVPRAGHLPSLCRPHGRSFHDHRSATGRLQTHLDNRGHRHDQGRRIKQRLGPGTIELTMATYSAARSLGRVKRRSRRYTSPDLPVRFQVGSVSPANHPLGGVRIAPLASPGVHQGSMPELQVPKPQTTL